ncbi:MAG: LysR family transcriptional regulator [Parvularculaceae bacterium]
MSGARVNLRHLHCFCEVAKRRSISAASKSAHLSQPAITQALAKLEAELATPLFERRSSGMYLTRAGDAYHARVGRALQELESGAKEALKAGQRNDSKGFASFHRMLTAAQLRALVAVVETGNFSLAARAAGVSQPTIHRGARDLERLAGVKLFQKTSLGIQPTRAAKLLARRAKLAFNEIEHGRAEIDALGGRDAGRIAVGAMPLARAYILPKALTALTREFPGHQVSIVDGPYEHLLSGLRHGDIDLLLGALRDPAPIDDIRQEPLFDDPLAIVMRARHPLAGKRKASVEALADYPWIAPRIGTPLRKRFHALFENAGVDPPEHVIECSSVMAARALLLESDRLTLLSPHQVRYELKAGLLAAAPHPFGEVARAIAITTRKEWAPTRAQTRLIELLGETARALGDGDVYSVFE